MKEQFEALAIQLATLISRPSHHGQLPRARKLARNLLDGLHRDAAMPHVVTVEAESPREERKPRLPVHVRWMVRQDMPSVLSIEGESFEHCWTEEDFIRCLRQRNCIGKVAIAHENDEWSDDDALAGFMVYELQKGVIRVLNLAVARGARRRGVGRALIQNLKSNRRKSIILEVADHNLDAQQFFKAEGFRAISVAKNFYEDHGEDAYVMEWRG